MGIKITRDKKVARYIDHLMGTAIQWTDIPDVGDPASLDNDILLKDFSAVDIEDVTAMEDVIRRLFALGHVNEGEDFFFCDSRKH